MLRKLAVILLALTIGGCGGRKPGDPLRPGFNVYSPEQDIQLGREAAQQVAQQADIVRDANLQRYIKEVGARLAKQPGAGEYPYEFTLINDPSINAFALPGGPIFVHSGLIAAADNEAQLAGVLAHEIAHVALRHGTSQASKANLIQLPAALASAVLGQGSLGAQLGQVGLGFGLNVLMLRYSRSAEQEADALGARLLAGAGYNPLEMATFFEKLEAEGAPRAPQFLSSHPNPGNRVQDVQAEVRTFPARQYDQAGAPPAFQQAKQLVSRLPKPNPRVQQAAAVAPSPRAAAIAGFETLATGPFALAYPRGWNVYGTRGAASVTIAPQQGIVRDRYGRVSVGYGVIAGYYEPQRGTSTLEGATRELLGQLQAGNPSVRVQGGMRSVNVSGSQGAVATLASASPFDGVERNVLLTVARPQGLFYMVFIAPDQHFGQVSDAFEQMIQSIRFTS